MSSSKPKLRRLSRERDGTSQIGRRLPALEPGYVSVDERGMAELLRFARALSHQLRFYDERDRVAGDWGALFEDPETGEQVLPTADILAFVEDPSRFGGDALRWLARPHFVLLLTFLDRLGHVRGRINDFTRRHLEHYYEGVLQMQRKPAEPDHVSVLVRLAPGVPTLKLDAGALFDAGKDPGGRQRSYALEHDLYVNRARIEQLRSVFVERRVTELVDIRRAPGIEDATRLRDMFELALGSPGPGDPVPDYGDAALGEPLFADIEPFLAFANPTPAKAPAPQPPGLYLEFHELSLLTRLLDKRVRGEGWPEIYERLGVAPPDPLHTDSDPEFEAVLAEGLGLTPNYDGLTLVENVDDLYDRRFDDAARAFIVDPARFGMDFGNFESMMQVKLRIDGEWAQVNHLLGRAGRRERRVLSYALVFDDPKHPRDPTNFEANLAEALEGAPAWPATPASWPAIDPQPTGILAYQARIDSLLAQFFMSANNLLWVARLATSAQPVDGAAGQWRELEDILLDAHRERSEVMRMQALDHERQTSGEKGPQALDHLVLFVLGSGSTDNADIDIDIDIDIDENLALAPEPLYAKLVPVTSKGQVDLLLRFRQELADQVQTPRVGWPDAYRVLELAQRNLEGEAEPVPRKVEWRNVHAFEDARAVIADPAGTRWKTFGAPPAVEFADAPPPRLLGFGLRSPLLTLSQGERTIELVLAFAIDGLPRPPDDQPEAVAAYEQTLATVRAELVEAIDARDDLVAEVSTEAGWVELPGLSAVASEDLFHEGKSRPTITLSLTADASFPPIAPASPAKGELGEPWPSLRLMLRQHWDEPSKSFVTHYDPFEPIDLVAAVVSVSVTGLGDLQVQAEASRLDANKPFEPFGSRPLAGSRFYVGHRELACKQLASLKFRVEWAGLPEDAQGTASAAALAGYYTNYPNLAAPAAFELTVDQIDDGLPRNLATNVAMFGTGTTVELALAPDAPRVLDLHTPRGDLREWTRSFRWQLERDFGHGIYPRLLAQKSREMTKALSANPQADVSGYVVNPPYTPTILSLVADYEASETLSFSSPAPDARPPADRMFHALPFGTHTLNPEPRSRAESLELEPPLLPRYDSAGELYVGLARVEAPQRLSLLVQLAEGTSDPDAPPAAVEWSELSDDRWRSLSEGRIRSDTTRGLINSGIVEIDLQQAGPSTRLPGDLHWLKLAIGREASTRSVCDAVDLHTQAGTAVFVDQDNDPRHYEQPLAPGTIKRLRRPNGKVGKIEQPYTGAGGKPSERAEEFYTRVSERLRHKQRALSPWDYERLVLERFGQLYKAKCLPATLAGRAPGLVELIVIPDVRARLPADPFGPKAPANLLADIHDYLRQLCPPRAEIRVRNPRYVEVKIRLDVRFTPGEDVGYAIRKLNEDLEVHLSPWAYDAGADIVIGGKIYANSIVDFVDRLDYVDYVGRIRLFTSKPGGGFQLHPEVDSDYHVAATDPDQVLVSAREHEIFVITETDYHAEAFAGINYMKIELDFIVG